MDGNTPGAAELIRHPLDDDVLREWMECPGAGEPLEGLISSKLPLTTELNNKLDDQLRYSKVELLQQQKGCGREVGLVIDLTATEHLCSPEEWEGNGVRYLKIPCKGNQELPDPTSVNKFVFEVINFFHANRSEDTKTNYIVVHGIHGYNRTGFMIVHYLMRIRGGILSQALQAFAAARPPGIHKQTYIDSLFASYNTRGCSNFICPWRPIWRKREDSEADGRINQLEVSTSQNSAEVLIEDTLGDAIPEEYQLEMQKICYWALELISEFPGTMADSIQHWAGMTSSLAMKASDCHLPWSRNADTNVRLGQPPGQGKMRSPQAVPKSLIRSHFDGLFLEKYYRATWQPIGPRYMLLICRDGCYLINRYFQFRRVQMRFPRKGTSKGKCKTHHYTLLDGEMVMDIDVDSKLMRRFLVVDLLMLNQQHTKNFPFHVRYQMIHDEITVPRHDDRGNIHYYYDKEAFRVRRKPFYNLSSVKNMIFDFIPNLSHPADGVLFKDWDGPYMSSQHEDFLQWKFVHCIDLLVKVHPKLEPLPPRLFHQVSQTDPQSLVHLLEDEGKLKQVAIEVLESSENIEQLTEKVIKCGWQPVEKKWKVIDSTSFQKSPSSWTDYEKVVETVKRDLSQTELVQAITTISRSRLYAARDEAQRS